MPDLTEYGDLMLFGSPPILDEWGKRKINALLEDGTKIIVVVIIYPITVSDSGIGTDVLSQFERTFLDSGIGIDVLSQFERSFLDSGLGEDVLNEFDRVFTDSGIGSDVSSSEGQVSLADSGIGTDTMPQIELPVTDLGVGTDILSEFDRTFIDSGIGSEIAHNILYELRTFINIVESGLGVDLSTIGIGIPVSDSGIGTETAHNILHELKTFINIVESGLGIDLPTVLAGAIISDSGIGSEVIRYMWWRRTYVNISEFALGTDLVRRDLYYTFQDKVKAVDVITKVAYKLAGYDVRRAYFHKVWYDIIEDTDHNIRVDVLKVLLQKMIELKEELE